ncbi:KDEL motif-containing protein 1 [Blattella germanica]|nr:KDEL motif-containing protein 1 [Blattella germanica]
MVLKVFVFLLCSYPIHGLGFKIDPTQCSVVGPGLYPDKIVMPARYFYIESVDKNNNKLTESPGDIFKVEITGDSIYNTCRVWINILDKKDGSFIVRYKMYHTCHNVKIHITYEGVHIASPVYADGCYCPEKSFTKWMNDFGCETSFDQINTDLKAFPQVNFTDVRNAAIEKFDNPRGMSMCHYAVKDNKIFRKCYGEYTGFKMFLDSILLSLARKVHLPDMEMLFNLGDWPLAHIERKPHIPFFSWCGSDDSLDIVMPTYDITESTLECMGRVMLDMLSVQGNIEKKWEEKIEKAFWRGRDSRRERLDLIDIAREHPDLFNASLTNFFFFRDEEKLYGPKEKHISFFKFFNYKYQVNIDGTVAAYRFPYLLVGDSLVLKQDSKYYEHFYKHLKPWQHYIPFKSDLSNLVERIEWAKNNDAKAKEISKNGRKFAQENLMPQDIFCYHAVLFNEWSKRLIENVEIHNEMEHVPQPKTEKPYRDCNCHRIIQEEEKEKDFRDEL